MEYVIIASAMLFICSIVHKALEHNKLDKEK